MIKKYVSGAGALVQQKKRLAGFVGADMICVCNAGIYSSFYIFVKAANVFWTNRF
jgi:hypothetical protein